MNVLFVAILFSNAVVAFSLLLVCFQRHAADDRLIRLLAYVTASSMIWSLGAGLLVVQYEQWPAQICRSIDLHGTVNFMISTIMLLNCIAEYKGRQYKFFLGFSIMGYALVAVSLFPEMYTFARVSWGMSFRFKNKAFGNAYIAYFAFCAIIMLHYLVGMLKSRKKSILFFGKSLLIIMIIILIGAGSDMIQPYFGTASAPGSSIVQFWALLIIWYAVDNISHSQITAKNMSNKVYYNLTSPVIMANVKGEILACNDAAREFFQFSGKQGEKYASMYDLFTLPDADNVPDLQQTLVFEAYCHVNNIYCNIVSNTVFDNFGEPLGYISVITDLTKQLEAMEKIEEARKEAIEANKAKSLFLANMSHEIRTPVNAIVGFSDVALSENPPENIRDYLVDIKNASATLLSSINDILNISKIESGKLEIINEEYSFRRLLRNVSKIISLQASEKNLTYDIELSGLIPHRLYGDDVRIQEILMNLCNNSVKYTMSGGFKLKVYGEKKNDDMLSIQFKVEDTGIGIKKEDMANLFTAYERMDKEKNHRTEGTGLGLSIVHGYVDLMGGTIDVESEYSKGTTFTVTLTQKIVDETPISVEDIMKSEDTSSGIGGFIIGDVKILVVDDNRVNLKVMSKILGKYGVNPDLALSGPEALAMCENTEYPLIFMDHMMPDMDGCETMLKLRESNSYYRDVSKIVVLTANAVDGVKEELINAGFDDYLSKPLSYIDLENIIEKYIVNEREG